MYRKSTRSSTTVRQTTANRPVTSTSNWHRKPTSATPTANTVSPRPAALKSLEATEQLGEDVDEEWRDDWKKLEDSSADGGSQTEHDRFAKLKIQLEKKHHEKVAKVKYFNATDR